MALFLAIGVIPIHAFADSGAAMPGDGSAGNPYRITTLAQLNAVRDDLDASYRLEADIDASDTAGWNAGEGFEPIGNFDQRFKGDFDGNGHLITGLAINSPESDFIGLFGYLDGGKVHHVGLENVDIKGKQHVGGIAGYSANGEIANAYTTGRLNGGTNFVGGIAGTNDDGMISNVYSAADVSGQAYVGGLTGFNENANAIIVNAYAVGRVSGGSQVGGVAGWNLLGAAIMNVYASGRVSGNQSTGGLVGLNENAGAVIGGYWDMEATGVPIGAGALRAGGIFSAIGLGTAGALRMSSYAGFDFGGTWFMVDGATRPFLRSEWSAEIRNPHQLQLIAMNMSANYTLARDIDFGAAFTDDSASDMWATRAAADGSIAGAGFAPLGRDYTWSYTGLFDGQDRIIRNLTINRQGAEPVGLFGMVGSGGVVRSVGLEGGSVTGNNHAGALVGYNNTGTVETSYATTAVRGNQYVGGLVGTNGNNSAIRKSHASGDVTGHNYVGGLVGYNTRLAGGGLVSESYAEGSVTGIPIGNSDSEGVGGLVGLNDAGTIEKSYATGSVAGQIHVGGLVGTQGFYSVVDQSYATGNVAGSEKVGGLAGMQYGQISRSYASGRVTGTDFVGGLAGRIEQQAKISNAYAVGPVEGRYDVGGLVGRNVGSIDHSYAAGSVKGSGDVGGLVGRLNFGTESASYYDRETTGQSGNGKGEARTTAEMKRRDTFGSWDFAQIWTLQAGKAYPVLRDIAANLALDAAPPTVESAQVDVAQPDRLVVTFDEEVTAPDASGVAIGADGTPMAIASIGGSGTKTLTFVVGVPFEQSQAVALSYDGSRGTITDLANNALRSFEDLPVAFADRTPPRILITMTTADGSVYEDGAWTNQQVTVNVSASDKSGVGSVTYSLGGEATWSPYTADIVLREDGVYAIAIKAIDTANNEAIERRTVKIGTSGLTLTPKLTKADGSAYASGEWTNASVTVSVYAAAGTSDIASLSYTLDGGAATAYESETPIGIAEEGAHTIAFLAADKAGNTISLERTVKIDKTPPSVAFSPNGSEAEAASASPTATAADSLSGIDTASLQFAWTNEPSPPSAGWATFANGSSLAKSGADGDWYLQIRARDQAGNERIATSQRYRLTTQTENGSGSSGGSGSGSPVLPDNTYLVGADGLTIPFDGGQLVFPAGAMKQPFYVTVQPIAHPEDLTPSGGERLVSRAFRFTKDAAGTFDKAVIVSLKFSTDTIRKDEAEVLLCWFNEATKEWVALDHLAVDWEKGIVSGTTDRFTDFAVIARPMKKEEPGVRFTDLQGHWAEAAIEKFAAIGAVNGYADGTFKPDRSIARAEFAAMLVRALGLADQGDKVFADTAGHWARQAVSTAYANGIVQGLGEDTFEPDKRITREQMAVMTMNALNAAHAQTDPAFADQDRISAWARQAVADAIENGMIEGYPDNTMRPQAHATRAEAVTVIWRALEKQEKQ
ncbi:GLUG motif-containing protein [Cohnella nanjingensis]|nr:GLUG motif-containing protein [Cohnella nanjingensis]